MVHSASITSWPTEFERVYLTKHLKFLAIAISAASIAGALPARFWFRAAPWLFVGTLILLVAVLIPGVGTRVNGAQRWLRVAGFSMQPSELAKVTLPLFLARGMLLCRERLSHWFFGTVPFVVPTALTAGLVMLEPDLGTSAFLIGSAGLVLFFGGWPIRNFTVGIGAAVSAGVFLISVTSYRMRRITDFVSVWTDFRNSDAWQLKQSLIALGAGGLWGVGLGRGSQKLSFLPESNTDFVFAVVGEAGHPTSVPNHDPAASGNDRSRRSGDFCRPRDRPRHHASPPSSFQALSCPRAAADKENTRSRPCLATSRMPSRCSPLHN